MNKSYLQFMTSVFKSFINNSCVTEQTTPKGLFFWVKLQTASDTDFNVNRHALNMKMQW